ncbi:MAG: Gfo/Idh/MocA family oxidoreductase [Phycisphaeraceae bacterium]
MKALEIGIIGCGSIARSHIKAYREIGGNRVSWVYDVSAPAAEALAAEMGAEVAPSVAWLAHESGVDAVSVCSPPGAHLEACLPLLQAGVAVLCEKPLAATVEHAAQLAAAVEHTSSVFMVGYCHRFHPPVVRLKQLIDAGELGRPILFLCTFSGQLNIINNHRGDRTLSGGGCLMDNGAHAIDLLRHLFGEPTNVQALASNVVQDRAVEDVSAVQLQVGSAVAQIVNSYSTPVAANRLEWIGDRGAAVINYFEPGVAELLYRTSVDAGWKPVDCSGLRHRLIAEVEHFVECVRTGHEPLVGVADGLRANQLVEQAYQSARHVKRGGESHALGSVPPTARHDPSGMLT